MLRPLDGRLYVVRWIRADGRNAKHRYFRRHRDAMLYAAKMLELGKPTKVFRAEASWFEIEDPTPEDRARAARSLR